MSKGKAIQDVQIGDLSGVQAEVWSVRGDVVCVDVECDMSENTIEDSHEQWMKQTPKEEEKFVSFKQFFVKDTDKLKWRGEF